MFILTLISTVCYSKNNKITEDLSEKCETPCSSSSVVEDTAPANCDYNCPARINPVCGWDFNIYGDFLYWQVREKNIAPMTHTQSSASASKSSEKDTVELFDLDYHPGFKVGIGAAAKRDNWTFNLEYTRYHNEASKSGAISLDDFADSTSGEASLNYFRNRNAMTDNGLFDLFSYLAISNNFVLLFRSFDSHWKLNFNTIDLVAGRPYFLGTKLTLNPFFGLRGGWIDQNYNLTGLVPFTIGFFPIIPVADYAYNFLAKSRSWLIGPRVGVKSNWLVGKGFRIFGDAGAALVYQKFKITIKSFIPAQNQLALKIEAHSFHKENSFNPTFDAALGLGWGSYFNNKRWHFDLSAGYEFQFFYAQNEIFGERDSTMDSDSLILHGLTLSAKVDF